MTDLDEVEAEFNDFLAQRDRTGKSGTKSKKRILEDEEDIIESEKLPLRRDVQRLSDNSKFSLIYDVVIPSLSAFCGAIIGGMLMLVF